ncbi:MAG: NAD-dependent epimerase/dehydratase family protein [Bacteroidia bacterium]|nr:NAD-dependent epimerase/dehydratase family protein [Bacteroidia bacterium]
MKKVLITGSNGFIGRNLLFNLKYTDGSEVFEFDIEQDRNYLKKVLKDVDFVFHLAGVNRTGKVDDFNIHNTELTQFIVDYLIECKNLVPLVLASSTQVEFDNDYGKSKREAETHILRYRDNGGEGYIYRLTNVFGKWCRPNYNSVVATFCYNIANGKEITISDRNKELQLNHVDDIVADFKILLSGQNQRSSTDILSVNPTYKVTLGEIADLIKSFKAMSGTVMIPDINNDFLRKLQSTYLSYIPLKDAVYSLNKQTDERGYLFELIKSKSLGQIFVSKTRPGITRGNHFHHLKNEKFCVIEGTAIIKLRHLISNETYDYFVNGKEPVVVNILPGYAHSVTNIGKDELITLFWANEPFDKERPDTYFEKV